MRIAVEMDSSRVDEVLAIIPARSGSKSIPDKNIRFVGGKPLLAWSIEYALQSAAVTRTIVSTDSERYAQIAREYGAEVPFLRPAALAGDLSTDLEVFQHALRWLELHESFVPDVCVHLRPTYPLRRPGLVDELIETLRTRPDLDGVRTVSEVVHPPFKMWFRDDEGRLAPVISDVPGIHEPWNEPRQNLPTTYLQNANIDVIRTPVITQQNSMTGKAIFGYVEPDFLDIDTPEEMQRVSARMQAQQPQHLNVAVSDTTRTFCFDMDGVIATLTPDNDYLQAEPRWEMIALIRRLFGAGHRIIIFTARGSLTGKDWHEVTMSQLLKWDVPFDELRFGKPAADFYIDDRMLSFDQLDQITRKMLETCA